jgi:hypothetical protein
VEVKRRFGGIGLLNLQDGKALLASGFMMVSCLVHSSIIKARMVSLSETSLDFDRTTLNYISGDRIVHNHCSEKLKPYMILFNSFSSS